MGTRTLEELMPELGTAFAVQEASLYRCVSAMSSSIVRAEDEARQKVSANEIQALRLKVRDTMDYVNEAKKTMQSLERSMEALSAEIESLKRENVEKDRAIEALQDDLEDARNSHEDQLVELDKKFEFISKVKMEQKDVIKRLEKQEKASVDMRYGITMLSKSINDEGHDENGGIAPVSLDSKLDVIASVLSKPQRGTLSSDPLPRIALPTHVDTILRTDRSSIRSNNDASRPSSAAENVLRPLGGDISTRASTPGSNRSGASKLRAATVSGQCAAD
ncbi:hypothetical protein SDRG_13712 [Saprolegnia diclina VS20]|uniref:Uncharacterized protein n=1 Tax=Saprolegnia diclina (strain VS20) TaxID=1156394 RepID=T0R917_SAPDV|nr:hypothetical protein SDRG_13712 [Saprolegnia diclina VS20]EQC28633.1 hypothetical protein SDRG_13712 [Saprolegnia diclina VS20]|eukprot:XP_008618030.1 hypothetical protein SDRG_13712 [Saprolegnia diclina VS20]